MVRARSCPPYPPARSGLPGSSLARAWGSAALLRLAGAVALAILMVPPLARATEELVRLVPDTLREAALAPRRPALEDEPAHPPAHRARRHHHRVAAGSGRRRRGDGAAPLHCAQQPVLELPDRPAHGIADGADLQLRDQPLRGVAPAGLVRGSRAPPARRGLNLLAGGGRPAAQAAGRAPRSLVRPVAGTHGCEPRGQPNSVLAVIGPSGCGKSTFLRCLNRMHELRKGARAQGRVLLEGRDVCSKNVDPVELRPCPAPWRRSTA